MMRMLQEVALHEFKREWRTYELLNNRANAAYNMEADEEWAYRRSMKIRKQLFRKDNGYETQRG